MVLACRWLWEFALPEASVAFVHQADDSGNVALADDRGGVYLLDAKGKLLLDLKFPEAVQAVRVVQAGEGQRAVQLVILDRQGHLQIFDLRGKKQLDVLLSRNLCCMDARSQGQAMVAGGTEGEVFFVSARGKILKNFYLPHAVNFVKFAFTRAEVVAASAGGQVSYLSRTGEPMWTVDLRTVCLGVDVDQDASLILLPTPSEGVYAFNRDRETIGAYDIDGFVRCAVLCQQGQRIIVLNTHGRLHVLRRDGSLEDFLDIKDDVARADLNFAGDMAALQIGERTVKGLSIAASGTRVAIETETTAVRGEENNNIVWRQPLGGSVSAQVRLTLGATYAVCLTSEHELCIFGPQGEVLRRDVVLCDEEPELWVSRLSNTILIQTKKWLDMTTVQDAAQNLPLRRLETQEAKVAVHDGGLYFAVVNHHQQIGFFDKSLKRLWSQPLDSPAVDLKINARGSWIFALLADGRLLGFRADGTLPWQQRLQPGQVADKGRFDFHVNGISTVSGGNEVERFDHHGKSLWKHKMGSAVVGIEALRDYLIVRTQNGAANLFDASGRLVASREAISGLREFAVNRDGHVLVVETSGQALTCENLTTGHALWRHTAPSGISQSSLEMGGEKLAYVAAGFVTVLALRTAAPAAAQSVAFLEI